jgi:hypothetical protein
MGLKEALDGDEEGRHGSYAAVKKSISQEDTAEGAVTNDDEGEAL